MKLVFKHILVLAEQKRSAHSIATIGTVIGLAAASITAAWAQQASGSLKEQIVGTWALTAQWVEQDGKKIERFGSNPKGIVIYDKNGRFASILMRSDLPKIASNNAMTGTPDENKAIVQGSTAFFGRWSVNERDGTFESHIDGATFPAWDGQIQKRTITISGDELKGCVPGAQIGGTACATYRRVR